MISSWTEAAKMDKQQPKLLMLVSIVISLISVLLSLMVPLKAISVSLLNSFSAQLSGVQLATASASLRLISLVPICLIVGVIVRLRNLVRQRRELFKLFEKCNIPKAGKEDLLLGNVINIYAADDSLKQLHDYHKRLGPSFGVFYGRDPWVVSVDLELLQRVFVTEGAIHTDRVDFRLPFVSEFNESVFAVKGDQWKYQRKLLSPSFSHRQMKTDNVFEEMNRICHLMMDYIEAHKEPVGNDGGDNDDSSNKKSSKTAIVDVLYGFKRYTLETFFRIAFGRENQHKLEPSKRDHLLDRFEQNATLISGPITFMSIMSETAQRVLGAFSGLTPLGACIRYTHGILDNSLDKRRKLLKERNGKLELHERKMIDSLIESYSQGRLNDTNLKANLFFILLAGYETTSSALTMMTYYLAHHPEIQDKLRRSIVLEGDRSEYLDWCIKETMRMWPPAPTSFGRVIARDFEHKGQVYKKGMSLVASISSIHKWPEYWGADVDTFRPERHGEPHENELINSLRFFGFGAGSRNCIGKNLALAEIKAIMSRLLMKYNITTCSSTPVHIDAISPNMVHTIIRHPMNVAFEDLNTVSE